MSLFDRKSGFIGIEVVIIASLVMSFGALSANRFVQQGQGSTGAFDKAYEHTKNVVEGGDGLVDNEAEELPEEGEGVKPEIRYETKWYYGDLELPKLPEEITDNYQNYFIGEAFGCVAMMGTTTMPIYDYYEGTIYNEPTNTNGYYAGNYLQFDNGVKYDAYLLINNNWVHFLKDENTASYVLVDVENIYWSNRDIQYRDGSYFLKGSQPEQKQVPIEE